MSNWTDIIQADDDAKLEEIPAPGFPPVFVRVWTPEERAEFRNYYRTREDQDVSTLDFVYVAWLSACDEHGTRIFGNGQLEALRGKQGAMGLLLERIAMRAMQLNDMAKPIEDAKKNSETTRNSSSNTNSPESLNGSPVNSEPVSAKTT